LDHQNGVATRSITVDEGVVSHTMLATNLNLSLILPI